MRRNAEVFRWHVDISSGHVGYSNMILTPHVWKPPRPLNNIYGYMKPTSYLFSARNHHNLVLFIISNYFEYTMCTAWWSSVTYMKLSSVKLHTKYCWTNSNKLGFTAKSLYSVRYTFILNITFYRASPIGLSYLQELKPKFVEMCPIFKNAEIFLGGIEQLLKSLAESKWGHI